MNQSMQTTLDSPPNIPSTTGRGGSHLTLDERINILVVDDEPKNLMALETVLDFPDYRLVKATSADEALLALVAEDFALLILDIQMPGMNGFDLASMIKQRKKTASIPIIFLTAYYSEDEHVLAGYSTGAVDFLHKPINPVVLRSKVAVFAELHRKTRESAQITQFLLAEVAERRGAQEELRELNAELEQRVLDRTAALTESEARFRALAEEMPHLVWETDSEGRPTYQNSKWYSYTGLKLDQTGEGWRRVIHSDDIPVVEEAWKKALREGEEFDIYCRHLRSSDGEYRWFRIKSAPVKNEVGAILRWVGTSTDIHEQWKAEEALREADKRKDEFLAMLGHELRNPLAAIRQAVRIGQESGSEAETQAWASEIIDRQSSQLTRMVEDLLDVERINRGRIELRIEEIDLQEVLRRAISSVQPLMQQRHLQLTHHFSETPVMVKGDAARLEQVFVNLLNNAAKYTPETGSVELRIRQEKDEVSVFITDTGVGIAPELLPHIFDLFTQARTSLDRAEGGLGIGLTVVRSLVEMHGGKVSVKSEGEKTGTTFTVAIPLHDSEPAKSPLIHHPPPSLNGVPRKIKVLIVDDHVDASQTLMRLLARRNCDVCLAHDGPGGVIAAREFVPEVLLLDLGLPGFDGYELARTLRRDKLFRDALFIAISGYAQASDQERSIQAGFDYHCAKPVNIDTIVSLIRSIEI